MGKRGFLAVLIFLTTSLLLTGCGSAGEENFDDLCDGIIHDMTMGCMEYYMTEEGIVCLEEVGEKMMNHPKLPSELRDDFSEYCQEKLDEMYAQVENYADRYGQFLDMIIDPFFSCIGADTTKKSISNEQREQIMYAPDDEKKSCLAQASREVEKMETSKGAWTEEVDRPILTELTTALIESDQSLLNPIMMKGFLDSTFPPEPLPDPPPKLFSVSLNWGTPEGGNQVSVAGQNLDGDTINLKFGGNGAEIVGVWSGRLQVIVPAYGKELSEKTAVDVTISTEEGSDSLADGYWYVP